MYICFTGRSSASIRRQEIESSVADADICYESSDSAGMCMGVGCVLMREFPKLITFIV